MYSFFETLAGKRTSQSVMILFALLFGWWIVLHARSDTSADAYQLWAASYQIIALLGGLFGFAIAQQWGGVRSVVGRAIIAFSLGLFFQVFGQSAYSYYIYFLHEPVPYPSIGDIGYFGSIPLYFYGAFQLARASGVRVSLKSYHNLAIAVLLPLILLWASYMFFLRTYNFDWTQSLKIFLDFGYPLGQAGYVSAALLAYLLSRNLLGGIMRAPIIAFIISLIVQYLSDFTFLYQANHGNWYAGGLNDLTYAFSYLCMSLALVYIGSAYDRIQTTYPGSIVEGVFSTASTIFSKIASSIIHEQALVIGPLAWTEAQKVQGLSVNVGKDEVFIASEDARGAIDGLVAQYERLFGPASHEVCRAAAASIVSTMPRTDVPVSFLA